MSLFLLISAQSPLQVECCGARPPSSHGASFPQVYYRGMDGGERPPQPTEAAAIGG